MRIDGAREAIGRERRFCVNVLDARNQDIADRFAGRGESGFMSGFELHPNRRAIPPSPERGPRRRRMRTDP